MKSRRRSGESPGQLGLRVRAEEVESRLDWDISCRSGGVCFAGTGCCRGLSRPCWVGSGMQAL